MEIFFEFTMRCVDDGGVYGVIVSGRFSERRSYSVRCWSFLGVVDKDEVGDGL